MALPSFYKILFDPSAPHLPLPSAFINSHFKNKIPKDPIMICANGGYSWSLKIKKFGQAYCFTNGWYNVVKDAQLGIGDLLLFQFLDHDTLKMMIYTSNGCQKVLSPKIELDDHVVVHDDADAADDDGDDDDDPFFTSVISKTHNTLMRLPVKFAKLAGINGEGTITVKNLKGEEWVMGLRLDEGNVTGRYYMSSGWTDFRRTNDLREGDKCVFKFIKGEGKLCLASVAKKERIGDDVDVDVKSEEDDDCEELVAKRGRPPKYPRGSPPVRPRGRPHQSKSSAQVNGNLCGKCACSM